MSSAIRNREPGYSISFERKKQYAQSRLQTAPVGFARRWKAGGASGTVETELIAANTTRFVSDPSSAKEADILGRLAGVTLSPS
jgi:hypothetical protein